MNEPQAGAAPGSGAGDLLRAAREKQGLHIAALAAAIKVAPAKLEALEAGRWQELPDLTFTRALAQSVCRVLKVDPKPVLDLLPSTAAAELEKVDAGLKTPFRERPARMDPIEWSLWRQPVFWGVLVLLLAAAGFLFAPAGWRLPRLALPSWGGSASAVAGASAPTPATVTEALAPATPGVAGEAAASAALAAPAPSAVVETVHSAPPPGVASASAPAGDLPTNMVVLHAQESSWVDVTDARGQSLLSRTLQPGEAVGLDGDLPIKVKIGNAAGTQLSFRGKALDLTASTRDNVARVELK
jgi:cytoskeleton protein RodZ